MSPMPSGIATSAHLNPLDQTILKAVSEYSQSLVDAYGYPVPSIVAETAQALGEYEIDVYYSLKWLAHLGWVTDWGVAGCAPEPPESGGFFSLVDVMKQKSASHKPVEMLQTTPVHEFVTTAISRAHDRLEKRLGYEWADPKWFGEENAARLMSKQTLTADEVAAGIEPLFLAIAALDENVTVSSDRLRKSTPRWWSNTIAVTDENRRILKGTRPLKFAEVAEIECGLIRTLFEYEKYCEELHAEIRAAQLSVPPLPDLQTVMVEKDISAIRTALEVHMGENAAEIVPAIQADLGRLGSTNEKDFPDPLTGRSLCGIVGEFVQTALSYTEADENNLASQFLAGIGNVLGTGNFATFGTSKHYPCVFQLVIGSTSAGKGQAWSNVKALLGIADEGWLERCKYSAASGEAVARLLSENELDPRVFLVLEEVSVLLTGMQRDGSTLSGYLRQAYDRGPIDLNKARGTNSYRAKDYLLSCVGHVTPQELTDKMASVDFYNGISNRFLWSIVRKSKTLPRMSREPSFANLADKIRRIVALPAQGKVEFSNAGGKAWDAWVMGLREPVDGKLAAAVERSKPNALRIALIYSLLDEQRLTRPAETFFIEKRHVDAATEIIDRSRQSVEWFLKRPVQLNSNSDWADVLKLKKAVNEAGGQVTATQLHHVFSNRSAEQRIDIATRAGLKLRKIQPSKAGSKPVEVWGW